MMIKDKELLEMLGDPKTQRAGFTVLVSQYSETLYWKIRNIVLNHDDPDDILQNVFIKAWTNLQPFRVSHPCPPGSTASPSTNPWISSERRSSPRR